jgi:hypothetical protein
MWMSTGLNGSEQSNCYRSWETSVPLPACRYTAMSLFVSLLRYTPQVLGYRVSSPLSVFHVLPNSSLTQAYFCWGYVTYEVDRASLNKLIEQSTGEVPCWHLWIFRNSRKYVDQLKTRSHTSHLVNQSFVCICIMFHSWNVRNCKLTWNVIRATRTHDICRWKLARAPLREANVFSWFLLRGGKKKITSLQAVIRAP